MAARRIKLIIQYDGAGYFGWQRQPEGSTIQAALEAALEKMLGRPVAVHAAGRTDSGVHALAMPAHVDLEHPIPTEKLPIALAAFLPAGLGVLAAEDVPADFDARRSAILRWYRYQIMNESLPRPLGPRVWRVHRPLDLNAMEQGLALLRGHHDFRGFRSAQCQANRTELTLEQATLLRGDGALLAFDFKCRSFLHHMIRFLVGTLVSLGQGQLTLERMRRILDEGERPQLILCAPPEGLCLMAVAYGAQERARILSAAPAPPSF